VLFDADPQTVKQVLDDVLDLQRMDSGKFNLKYEPFPFNTIVRASTCFHFPATGSLLTGSQSLGL
jgi:hypothetical protein